MRRHAVPLAATLLLAGGTAPANAGGADRRCPAAAPFAEGLRVVKVIRVVKGADGESAFVPGELRAGLHAYFKPGEMFGAIDFRDAKRVQLVSGPPNARLPYHASLAYEMFLTLQGSSTVVLPNGQERTIDPGTLVVMEDMGSKTGHAGRTGPCGYVALQVVPQAPIAL